MTALEAFDSSRHHIGLGPADEGVVYGFMLDGGYLRQAQQYGAPTDYGSEQDILNVPSLSRWSQDDFTGGAFQYTWGKDPAMFAGSLNLIPSQYDRSVRTVPPIILKTATTSAGSRRPLLMFVADGYLYVIFSCGAARFGLTGQATAYYGIGQSGVAFGAHDTITAAYYDKANHELLVAWHDAGTGGIDRFALPNLGRAGNTDFYPEPSNGGRAITKMDASTSQIVVQCGQSLWTRSLPDDKTAVASTADWTNRGRLPGKWQAAISFAQQLYILTANADDGTSLMTWDPKLQAILPVADFPFNFRGDSLTQLGGRVYVGGSGTDTNGGERYAELWEVTGSSIRLIRTFEPESRMNNVPHRPKTIRSLVAHEGLIWWGDKGRGLMAYDPTTDSIYGSSMFVSPDGAKEVWMLTTGRERVHAYVTNALNSAQDGIYRQAQVADDLAAVSYEGVVYTSDFAPQPDREKRWSKMVILTRGGSAGLGYSTVGGGAGGDVFTEIAASSTETHGELIYQTFDLSTIPLSKQVRFRIRLPRGTDVSGYTELVAFTCAFAFMDTGRWSWNVNVNGTMRVDLRDGDVLVQDIHDIGTELRRYWRDQLPLTYKDLDGQTYKVVVSRIQESQPVIGLPAEFGSSPDISTAQEAFYNLTLTEV